MENNRKKQRDKSQGEVINTVLARFIQLAVSLFEQESIEKKASILVNRINILIETDRVLLVEIKGRKRIKAVSGGVDISQDTLFAESVDEIRKLFKNETEPQVFSSKDFLSKSGFSCTKKSLENMGGTTVLWLPLLITKKRHGNYSLWIERWDKKPFKTEELKMVSRASYFFGHALSVTEKKEKKSFFKRTYPLLTALIFFLIMLIPVDSWINAPVKVVPEKPSYIFAPFDGVVKELLVLPGEKVKKGDIVFSYDSRVLEKRFQEAVSKVEVEKEELIRLEGASYKDQDSRAKIPVQKLSVKQMELEMNFIQNQLNLSKVRADADGIIVLDDPDAFKGVFLQTGQYVLSIANPARTKLKIMVPVIDAGLLQKKSRVDVRMDYAPLNSIPATLTEIGYEVRLSDKNIPSIPVEAMWNKSQKINPGQRGSAKITGPKVSLGMQLFRKPIIAVRTFFGV